MNLFTCHVAVRFVEMGHLRINLSVYLVIWDNSYWHSQRRFESELGARLTPSLFISEMNYLLSGFSVYSDKIDQTNWKVSIYTWFVVVFTMLNINMWFCILSITLKSVEPKWLISQYDSTVSVSISMYTPFHKHSS